jgi:hypothetical protein
MKVKSMGSSIPEIYGAFESMGFAEQNVVLAFFSGDSFDEL